MTYNLTAFSSPSEEGRVENGTNKLHFGVTKGSNLSSPAELLISAFAACCLKNVERFSEYMKFNYTSSQIEVSSSRQEKPPMISEINFNLTVYSSSTEINTDLLLRNLQKFGTIYNTLNEVCEIDGKISVQNKPQ